MAYSIGLTIVTEHGPQPEIQIHRHRKRSRVQTCASSPPRLERTAKRIDRHEKIKEGFRQICYPQVLVKARRNTLENLLLKLPRQLAHGAFFSTRSCVPASFDLRCCRQRAAAILTTIGGLRLLVRQAELNSQFGCDCERRMNTKKPARSCLRALSDPERRIGVAGELFFYAGPLRLARFPLRHACGREPIPEFRYADWFLATPRRCRVIVRDPVLRPGECP